MTKTVLIVDDDKRIANLIDFHLKKQGYETACIYKGREAPPYVRTHKPALVLLDIRLPDTNGVDTLMELKKLAPETPVIMISAHGDVKLAVECMKLGAYDFVEKPLAWAEIDAKIRHVFEQFRLREEISHLKRELGEKYKFKSILGKSPQMKKVFHSLDLAAQSNLNVLIEGESGTGKELIARAIHFNGPTKSGPFIAVNCGAIPEPLLESELFGHEKGAFTGAGERKIGKFEQAHGGTIFLDEIGDLPSTLQVKLLRVIQEREIERLGATGSVPIQVRFIAATHQDLKKMVQAGRFREDLYFRVNVFPIRIPPLRERTEDIPELLAHFARRQTNAGRNAIQFSAGALKKIMNYSWPGNVRELENFIDRLLLVTKTNPVINEEDIDLSETEPAAPSPAGQISSDNRPFRAVDDAERGLLEHALREANGNVSRASKILQVSRDTFYRKMKKYSVRS